MLDAGTPPEPIEGLLLAPDHALPSRWYVFADPPHVRRASLTLFRAADQPGGALLGLEVDLAIEAQRLENARQALAHRGVDAPEIVVPSWIDGAAWLIGPLAGPGDGAPESRMIVASLARTTPSLVGDERAVFAVRADEDGASLLRRTIEAGDLPAGVLYELTTLGLMSALGLRIEVDLRGAYDRFAAEIAVSSRIGKAAFQRIVEGMVTDRVMTIDVIDGSGGDAARADAITRAGEELATKMLQPTLSAVGFAPGVGKAPNLDIGFTLRVERDQLEAQASFSYVERRARRVAHRPQISLVGALAGIDPSTLVREVSAVDPFFASTSVRFELAGGLAAAQMSAMSIRAEWGVSASAPDDAQPLAASESLVDATTSTATLEAGVSSATPYRYRAHATYLASADAPPDRTSAWRDGAGEHQYFEPRALFPTIAVSVVAGRIDFGWIARAEVALQRGSETRTATFDAFGDSTTFVFDAPAIPMTVSATFHGLEGEPTWTTPPSPVSGEIAMVDAPFADSLSIVVVPVPTATTTSIVVELSREEAQTGFRHQRTVSFDAPNWTFQRALLRRIDGSTGAFTYRVTIIDDRGVTTTDAISTSASAIAVGDSTREPRRVDLALVRGAPTTTGDLAVEATVTPIDAEGRTIGVAASHVFQGAESTAEIWTTAPHDAPSRFDVRVKRVTNAGETKTSEFVAASSPIVLDA